MIETRQELRQVQYQLRADIESVVARIRFINIILWPAFLAAGLLLTRRRMLRKN
jgi:hypothetical protein